MPTEAKAYAATSPTSELSPFTFTRRDVGDNDISIDILYCGVCHSDIHQVRSEWCKNIYPLVPGHEIVGKVTKVGAKVTTFKEGQLAGVGCMVDSCRNCAECKKGEEQYCRGLVWTYASPDNHGGYPQTYGGYSTLIVVDAQYALHIPENLPLNAVAPLLCAGITTYSPLRYCKVGKGTKVAVLGLGGLGHMAVKLAHAFGADVTMLSSSKSKEKDARMLGADNFILTSDKDAMKKAESSFDVILNTVSAVHDYNTYLELLKADGTMILVGIPPEKIPLDPTALVFRRRSIIGSLIGGIKETQEMLDFCGKHNIVAEVEMIKIDYINKAYERMLKSDVKYRFVIDIASLKQ